MFRFKFFILGCLTALALNGFAQSDSPVTTYRGEAGDLVRAWWKEGVAAGNAGDFYDNRDRRHRHLKLEQFPQLSTITYSTNEVAAWLDYAAAKIIRTNVVIGNSSTSANARNGGSNSRRLYSSQGTVAFLYQQYVKNNLYAYPEHHDHDPGHNGSPGYGDLFPLNTPYLYTSQGSSGSEMQFIEATALTLAAFRPDVKAKLIQKGLLMPTIQMLMRRSYKPAPESADYLTGRAHPTVFQSALIDPAAMVRGANAITLETLPPMVQLRVVEEDQPRSNVDFFDLSPTEKLCDTSCAIGRVFRGVQRTRRMVVSADGSFDQNLRPLTWHWTVLRGDTNRIQIKPLNSRGSIAEITVAWHERRPIAPGAEIESNRVDIGCFVHNGLYYSAPAFICYFFPDVESRGYDPDGKAVDIGYINGTSTVPVANWEKLFELIAQDGVRAQFLKERLSEENWAILTRAGQGYKELVASERQARAHHTEMNRAASQLTARIKELEKSKKSSELEAAKREHASAAELQKAAAAAATKAQQAVQDHRAAAEAILHGLLSNWVARAGFTFTERRDLERIYKSADRSARDEFDRGKDLLAYYGFMRKAPGFEFAFTPARPDPAPLDERLTPFEKCLAARLNASAISSLILRGAVESVFSPNYVDQALSAKKDWRDVFHYDGKGEMSGWTRHAPNADPAEFNARGQLVEKGKVVPIRYEVRPDPASKERAYKLQWLRNK